MNFFLHLLTKFDFMIKYSARYFLLNMTDIEILCDFDGTITKKDTINYFLETYADKKWLDIEKNWEDGLIGSNECMTRQLELLPDITEKAVETFIKDIKIDDDFLEFYSWVKSNEIPFYILSDGFDFFISAILRKYKIAEIEFYSNKLELKHGRFVPFYANPSGNCEIKSAMCKCEVFNKLRNVKNKSIYIGDEIGRAHV